jgi:hypothetical protein
MRTFYLLQVFCTFLYSLEKSFSIKKHIATTKPIIEKPKINLCNNCKHYIEILYKESTLIGNYYGQCGKFMDINDITGEVDYLSALIVRNDETKCGRNGTLFEKIEM